LQIYSRKLNNVPDDAIAEFDLAIVRVNRRTPLIIDACGPRISAPRRFIPSNVDALDSWARTPFPKN
jgi:hypothetical protein